MSDFSASHYVLQCLADGIRICVLNYEDGKHSLSWDISEADHPSEKMALEPEQIGEVCDFLISAGVVVNIPGPRPYIGRP
jgi:hypothetical protein